MKIYDIVIIGAGVIGTSIARELSRYKLDIAILEKEIEPAFGVSKANSGIIHPGTQNPANSLKGRLCVEGNRLIRTLSKELGVDFKETGELIVAFDEKDISRLLELKKEAEIIGVPGLKIVDRCWLRKNEPNLNPDARMALFAPTAGIISPYRFVYDLYENALTNGVEAYTENEVKNILRLNSKNESYFEINTKTGLFKARFVINAAGLFADEISAMVGIREFKITPRKGEEFILDKKREYISDHLLFPLPSKVSKGVLVIKTADGNPMIGPTAEDIFDKEDLSTTDEGFKKVLNGARKLIPSINPDDIISYFAGLRPVSGDDFIIRHEDNAPGFINVAGIQSPGLTAAPAIAIFVKGILKEKGLKLRKKLLFHKKRIEPAHISKLSFKKAKGLIKKDPAFGDIVCRCELVSSKEVNEAISSGARTMDGIKFRTRAQSGRCHGSFCTTRIMKILSDQANIPVVSVTKKGVGSEIIKGSR